MKVESIIFNVIAVFAAAAAVVYGVWAKEPVGATALYNAFDIVWKLLATKAELDHGGKNLHVRNTAKVKVEASDWIRFDGDAVYLGKPPYYPVVTTAGPSKHVFAGIDPEAPAEPAGDV